MQQYQTRVRRMRPSRSQRERATEDQQYWLTDEDIKQARAYAKHAAETGSLPVTEQEN